MKSINKLLNSEEIRPSVVVSFYYLFRDIVFTLSFFMFSYYLVNVLGVSKLYYWPIYSIVMGTINTGLWVLGHECGHGSFTGYKIINDTVGMIIHTCLLVPYHAWQFTHAKHHKYTNHLTKGETHVPPTKKGFYKIFGKIHNIIGEDGFALLQIVELNWQNYSM